MLGLRTNNIRFNMGMRRQEQKKELGKRNESRNEERLKIRPLLI